MRAPLGRDCRGRPNKPTERRAFIRPIRGGPSKRDEALVYLENRDGAATAYFLARGYVGTQLQPVCTPGPGKANNCKRAATRLLSAAGAHLRFWNKPSNVWLDPWTARSLSRFPRARGARVVGPLLSHRLRDG